MDTNFGELAASLVDAGATDEQIAAAVRQVRAARLAAVEEAAIDWTRFPEPPAAAVDRFRAWLMDGAGDEHAHESFLAARRAIEAGAGFWTIVRALALHFKRTRKALPHLEGM